MIKIEGFSSPFIEERLYLEQVLLGFICVGVLVPFYRGAVVFKSIQVSMMKANRSRPLLSRSGCILSITRKLL